MPTHAWISTYIDDKGWVDDIIQFNGNTWQIMDSQPLPQPTTVPLLRTSVLAHTGSYLPAFPAAGALTCAGLVLVAATAFMAKREKEQKRNAKK